jgi:hypothetical protein
MKFILLVIFILAAACVSACSQTPAKPDAIVGDWSGESKCVGTNTSCHDEVVVYHISRSKDDAKKFTIAADKIVDGKPDFMGNIECDFDAEKQTLRSEFKIPRTGGTGVWLFKIKGDEMDGTLTVLPENEIGRRIKVKKNPRP